MWFFVVNFENPKKEIKTQNTDTGIVLPLFAFRQTNAIQI